MTTIRVHGRGVQEDIATLEVDPEGGDVEGVICRLLEASPKYGEVLLSKGRLRTDLNVLVNGRHCIFMNGLKTKVAEKDVIDILLPVIGG